MAVGGSQSTVSSCPYVEMIKCRGRGGTHPHLEENMSEASAEQIQDLISQLQNLPAMKAKSGSGNGSVLPRDDTMVAPTPSREGDKVLAGVQSDSQSITHDENVAVCEDVTTGGVAGTESGSEGGANGLESSGRDIGALSPVVMSALLSGEEAGTCGASDPLTPLVVSKGDPVVLLPHPLASPAPKEVLGNPDVSSSREGVLAALNSSDYSVTLQQVCTVWGCGCVCGVCVCVCVCGVCVCAISLFSCKMHFLYVCLPCVCVYLMYYALGTYTYVCV